MGLGLQTPEFNNSTDVGLKRVISSSSATWSLGYRRCVDGPSVICIEKKASGAVIPRRGVVISSHQPAKHAGWQDVAIREAARLVLPIMKEHLRATECTMVQQMTKARPGKNRGDTVEEEKHSMQEQQEEQRSSRAKPKGGSYPGRTKNAILGTTTGRLQNDSRKCASEVEWCLWWPHAVSKGRIAGTNQHSTSDLRPVHAERSAEQQKGGAGGTDAATRLQGVWTFRRLMTAKWRRSVAV